MFQLTINQLAKINYSEVVKITISILYSIVVLCWSKSSKLQKHKSFSLYYINKLQEKSSFTFFVKKQNTLLILKISKLTFDRLSDELVNPKDDAVMCHFADGIVYE